MLSRRACNVVLVLAVGALVPALAWHFTRPDAADDQPAPPAAPAEPGPLLWLRHDPPLETTWPDQPRFTSDAAPRPVAAGDLVLLTSSRHDSLTAVAAADGAARWRFAADGPIRFAPAVWGGRAYAASDDGQLYCLDLASGALKWKFRGGPAGRLVLGNERLISTWPARGAPAVALERAGGATVYFAAGIWPFMGIFLHALDAETGRVRWSNSGDGSTFRLQPHGGAFAFAGVAPQGSLVVAGDRLLVPGGRSVPACYDRHTGQLLHYRLASDVSKQGGGPDVHLGPGMYFNGPGAFTLAAGDYLGAAGEVVAVDGVRLVKAVTATVRAYDLAKRPRPKLDDKGKPKVKATDDWLGPAVASATAPAKPTVLLAEEKRVWGAGKDVVFALDLSAREGKVTWQAKLDGTPVHLAAAAGRVVVSTREGRVYAFTTQGGQVAAVHRHAPAPLPAATEEEANYAKQVLTATGARSGYAVVLGVGTGGLVGELLRQTEMRLIVVEADRDKAAAFREKLHQADIDGKRASVLPGDVGTLGLPPYLATLITGEPPPAADFGALFRALRPYGGALCLRLPENRRGPLRDWLATKPGEGQAKLRTAGELVVITRDGPLPGAADWTHQHADAANTRVSPDARVKAPLGVLWFGGPGHHGILPRHGHGPVPQVAEGRLVIEGTDGLRAIDIYTGRLLWEVRLPGLGKVYDNTAHQPGANAVGSNYVCTPQGVYVAHGEKCLRLDLDTGKPVQSFALPPLEGEKGDPEWTFLSVAGDYLIGGAGAKGALAKSHSIEYKQRPREALRGSETSRRLTVLDRQTGRPLWSIDARDGFRHNAICAGGGKLFAIDREPFSLRDLEALAAKLKADEEAKNKKPPRKSQFEMPKHRARLVAHDLATGRPLWEASDGVFGTWLSYSDRHDVLVEAGLMSRDTLFGEPAGMRAYQGSKGGALWYEAKYYGPALMHGDRILKGGDASAGSGTACEVMTGKPIKVPDPLTGVPIEWRWRRTYGCNTPGASRHLMLFRSGAAGYYDLCDDGGTGNIGGLRSSCTFNLIPAGGVLTLPDFTRTCTCAYQNQASLGLVHDPEAEMWTFTLDREVAGPVRRLGVNLGAPGGRKSADGTLWLEHPVAVNVGDKRAPRVKVAGTPAKAEAFRLHASQVAGAGPAWVTASGLRGLRRLSVGLGATGQPRAYTVRLYFLEPDEVKAGQRVFDVLVQGKAVLTGLDVAREAGGPRRGLVKAVAGVRADGELVVELAPAAGSKPGVLSGVEVVAEGW